LRIAEFWEKNCPQYYEVGVREVAEVDLNDKTKFYFGRYKFDLKYSGINVAGDAVATDGSLLFVRHSTGLRLNYGDNSNIGRKRYADVLDSPASAGKEPAARKKTPPMAKKPPPITTLTSCAINSNIGRKLYADVLDSASAGKEPAARKKTPPMAKKPPPITTLTSCAIIKGK
jgi:hypothetical protein